MQGDAGASRPGGLRMRVWRLLWPKDPEPLSAAQNSPSSARMDDEAMARAVTDVRFRATKFGTGYDQDATDQLLDRLVAELRRDPGAPRCPLEELRRTRLPEVRFREGYAVADVDALLRRVEDHLRGRAR